MNATMADVMHRPVMTITAHQTVGHAQELMATHKVSALPIVGPHVAARIMRNHKLHLVAVVEDHRFTVKNAPTPSPKGNARS